MNHKPNSLRSLRFLEQMQSAGEKHEAGFHFEEGGCWGMAAALQEELGGEIILRGGDFTHVYVRVAGQLYDWQGQAQAFNAPQTPIPPQELAQIALSHGCTEEDFEADKSWAKSIISTAKELHLNELIPTLQELGQEAIASVSDMHDDDELELMESMSDLDLIRQRFSHGDCDDFALALHAVTGWPIASINSSSHGPLHRLNIAPDGTMVDVHGFVSMDELKKRYKLRDLNISPDTGCGSLLDSDADLEPIVSTMVHLPNEPFPNLQQTAKQWLVRGAFLDVDEAPECEKKVEKGSSMAL